MKFIDKIPMQTAVVMALFLGLLPYFPEPHVWQKLKMLVSGDLVQLVDIGDLFLHGAPWILLIVKIIRHRTREET